MLDRKRCGAAQRPANNISPIAHAQLQIIKSISRDTAHGSRAHNGREKTTIRTACSVQRQMRLYQCRVQSCPVLSCCENIPNEWCQKIYRPSLLLQPLPLPLPLSISDLTIMFRYMFQCVFISSEPLHTLSH